MGLARYVAPPRLLLPLAAVYFVAGKVGLSMAFLHASASPVWPPAGIALGAVLLFGFRVWPAIFAGAFAVNVTTAGNVATSLGIATGNTLEALIGALLVTRFASGRDAFNRARDIFAFAVLAGGLATTVAATVGVTSLALGGYADWSRYVAIWLTWWLGDLAGAIVVAPVLVLWGTRRAARPHAPGALETALMFGAVILSAWVVCGGLLTPWIIEESLVFLCIPPLVWAAFRFGQRETATALALLAAIAVWGMRRGFGPFVAEDDNTSLLLLQAFMVTMTLTKLPLAAVVTERLQAEEGLARLAAIVESSDDAIFAKTLNGVIAAWNPGAERLFGYSAAEAVGRRVSLIVPPEYEAELASMLERVARGERVEPYDTVRMRKDGTRVEVSVAVSPVRGVRRRVVGASSIARDLTRRKEAEAIARERDQLRIIASLAAAAAHEINNPLAVVMGQAQLLAMELGERTPQRVREILEAGVRIQEIVRHMRHVERLEFAAQPSDLPEMLDLRRSGKSPPPAAGSA